MGRRPRRNQHERCRPVPPRSSGAKAAWLALFLLGFLETVVPAVYQPAPQGMVASDAGQPEAMPPVPVETWADASVGGGVAFAAFPAPAQGQKRPPCPASTVERNGACWRRTDGRPPCDYFEVLDSGACYMAVPERPNAGHVAETP